MYLTCIQFTHPTFSMAKFHDADWAHKRVMALYPADMPAGPTGRPGDVLFHIDSRAGHVLVQSAVQPSAGGVRTRQLPATVPDAGTRVRFHVDLNAVTTVTDGTRKRHQPVGEDDVVDYATRKLHSLTDLELVDRVRVTYRRKSAKLVVDRIDGLATIADVDAFADQRAHGVGRAKAYGCGLLLTAIT